MLREKKANLDINPEDPWYNVLSRISYAIRSTYRTIGIWKRYYLSNKIHSLVGYNIPKKKKLINRSNQKVNSTRVEHSKYSPQKGGYWSK